MHKFPYLVLKLKWQRLRMVSGGDDNVLESYLVVYCLVAVSLGKGMSLSNLNISIGH